MLIGKANEDFLDWITDKYFLKGVKYYEINIYQKGDIAQFLRFETTKYAYILEWFGTVKIHISAYQPNETGYWAINFEKKAKYNSRNEAVKNGIEYANEIYNAKFG